MAFHYSDNENGIYLHHMDNMDIIVRITRITEFFHSDKFDNRFLFLG